MDTTVQDINRPAFAFARMTDGLRFLAVTLRALDPAGCEGYRFPGSNIGDGDLSDEARRMLAMLRPHTDAACQAMAELHNNHPHSKVSDDLCDTTDALIVARAALVALTDCPSAFKGNWPHGFPESIVIRAIGSTVDEVYRRVVDREDEYVEWDEEYVMAKHGEAAYV